MLEWFKQNWNELKKSSPGKRFQDLYERRQQSRRGGLKKFGFIGGGAVLIATGVFSFPVPGIPSDLVILLGVAILAQGSRTGARVLDWIELRLRGPIGWARKIWKPLPGPAKIVIGVLWMSVLAVAGFGFFRLVFE